MGTPLSWGSRTHPVSDGTFAHPAEATGTWVFTAPHKDVPSQDRRCFWAKASLDN